MLSCLVVVVVVAVFRGLFVYLGSFWDTFDVVCDDPAVDTSGLSDAAGVSAAGADERVVTFRVYSCSCLFLNVG